MIKPSYLPILQVLSYFQVLLSYRRGRKETFGMALSNFRGVRTNQQGREIKQHGTAMFPVACYNDDLRMESVGWHWHDELEALIVENGSVYVAVGKSKMLLKQGDAIFINSNCLHAAWPAGPGPCTARSVVFQARLIGGSRESLFWQKYVLPVQENQSLSYVLMDGSESWHLQAIHYLSRAWENCASEEEGFEFRMRYGLSMMICLIADHTKASVRAAAPRVMRDNDRIKVMIEYIQDHYGEEITVDGIAGSAMVSESECLRCFKGMLGTTPIQYVKQFRIQKAEDLLRTTNRKVEDIAAECGFPDTSYFIKTFRQAKGVTPNRFRTETFS